MASPEETNRADAVCEALADPLRREVLSTLHEQDDVASVSSLVDEMGALADEPSGERVEVALHHVHLPKLDELGVVEFDEQNDTVRYQEDPLLTDIVTSPHFERTDGD